MNASDPRWSRLNIVGKAGLIGIGPFVSIGLFSMGAALPRMANGFAGAPNVDLLDLLIGSVVAPSCRRLT